MSGIDRWFPRLTLGVAGAHVATAVALYRDVYRTMLAEGLIGSGEGGPEREAATWFLVAGPALAGLGLATHQAVAETGRLPRSVPATVLGLGVLITVVSPRSGGWALVGLGTAGLLARRRTSPTDPVGPVAIGAPVPSTRA